MVKSKSLYRDEWSFSTVNQYQVLYKLASDIDKHDVEDAGCSGLLLDNPLHLDDAFLARIQMIGKSIKYEVFSIKWH